MTSKRRKTTTYGFKQTANLLESRIRKASESRGFAETRVLTHWAEIAGPELAALSRPVEVKHGRGGFGATLTVLTTGAHAPMLEMQKEALRSRINAIYGYNAIARLRITQTAATGFAEGKVDFAHKPKTPQPARLPQAVRAEAKTIAHGAEDSELRAALEHLAAKVLTKNKPGRLP